MPKVLATLLTFAALVSAAANAPGVMFASSKQPLAANVDSAGSAMLPAVDQGAWLDTALGDAQMQVASWRHTWTDDETDTDTYYTTPGASPYGRSVHWEPQGVLLAYEPHYADDVAYFEGLNHFGMRFAGRGNSRHSGSGSKTIASDDGADAGGTGGDTPATNSPPSDTSPTDTSQDDETSGDEPGTADPDAPRNEPPPGPTDDISVVSVVLPGPTEEPTDTSLPQPPHDEQPVSVPEPAPMGLLALGLAGIMMFGRRRSVRSFI